MDRRVGVPYIEVRVEGPKQFRIVTNRSFDDGRLTRFGLCQLLHPMCDVAADSTFVGVSKKSASFMTRMAA